MSSSSETQSGTGRNVLTTTSTGRDAVFRPRWKIGRAHWIQLSPMRGKSSLLTTAPEIS